jgi:hypothetical protein
MPLRFEKKAKELLRVGHWLAANEIKASQS